MTWPADTRLDRPKPPDTPCPEGFHWLGQSFATCDACGLPAWDHAGMAMPDREPASLSDATGWRLKPWEPGERKACQRKWGGDRRG